MMGQLFPDEISGILRIQYVHRDDALVLQSAVLILSDAVLKVLRYGPMETLLMMLNIYLEIFDRN